MTNYPDIDNHCTEHLFEPRGPETQGFVYIARIPFSNLFFPLSYGLPYSTQQAFCFYTGFTKTIHLPYYFQHLMELKWTAICTAGGRHANLSSPKSSITGLSYFVVMIMNEFPRSTCGTWKPYRRGWEEARFQKSLFQKRNQREEKLLSDRSASY